MLRTAMQRFTPTLLVAARTLRGERELAAPLRTTPMGFRFAGSPEMMAGTFEPDETALFDSILSEAALLVNAGANVGYYCCRALAGGRPVIAFEPISHNAKLLLRNVAANGWNDQVEVFPVALSDSAGIIEMFGAGTGASVVRGWAGIPATFVTLVPSTTLDNVLADRTVGRQCFVVMDVEGSEYRALRGAMILLEQSPRPHWMVEITVSEHLPAGLTVNPNLLATFSLFWDRGYEAWTAEKSPRLVTKDELVPITAGGPDTLKTHNFIFVDPHNRPHVLGAAARSTPLSDEH
jgi:FkbM family methyltransferase